VAEAAGVSKVGLLHHFPTQNALIAGRTREALAEIDRAMILAATEGRASETWLRKSVPNASERDLFRALITAHYALDDRLVDLVNESNAATERWEAMIAPDLAPTDLHAHVLFASIVNRPKRAQ